MDNAWLIAGLGNPGRQYARTRHNVGFRVVERLALDWGTSWADEAGFQSRLARKDRDEGRIFLCQPLTFMNASGEAVGAVASYYRIAVARTLVIVDDADLEFGELRLRARGSSGGHRGLDSVERQLGTPDYARLRVGIGRGPEGTRQIADFVLSSFEDAEMQKLDRVIGAACQQAECWMLHGAGEAMNRYNGRVDK